jgi:hypothetical protein
MRMASMPNLLATNKHELGQQPDPGLEFSLRMSQMFKFVSNYKLRNSYQWIQDDDPFF